MISIHFALDYGVLYVDLYVSSLLVREDVVYQPLVGSLCILQIERHHNVAKHLATSDDCHFILNLLGA